MILFQVATPESIERYQQNRRTGTEIIINRSINLLYTADLYRIAGKYRQESIWWLGPKITFGGYWWIKIWWFSTGSPYV